MDTSRLSVDGTIAVDAATARVLPEGGSTLTNLGTAAVTGSNGNYDLASVSMIPARRSSGEIEIAGLPEQPIEIFLDVTDDSQTPGKLVNSLTQLGLAVRLYRFIRQDERVARHARKDVQNMRRIMMCS